MQKILIICSTNRENAVTKTISEIYKELLDLRSIPSEIIDLNDLPADFIASALYEKSGKNPSFNPVRQKMKEAKKMVFIVPEYNGSFPGVLKTFIDGLEFPATFSNKKCALVGLSSGVQGAGLALSHLTDIFNYCGMHVLAQKPRLARIGSNMEDDTITNPLYRQLLEEQIEAFAAF